MDKRSQKKETRESILFGGTSVIILLTIFLPPSGKTALLDELCTVLLIWIATAYVIVKLFISMKTQKIPMKALKVLMSVLCIVAAAWFSKNLVLDAVKGPKTALLYHPQVEKYHGFSGLTALHYYLRGEDAQGELIRLEISEKDYFALQQQGGQEIEIEYYASTKRLASHG